jgi:hypothetical protein
MSRYPTPSEYQEAVQFPDAAFADSELQEATPRTNPLGLPQPVTGAFAAVFPMRTASGRTLAAKCFLADVQDQRERYAALSDHLAEADLDATVDFEYQPGGVTVDGDAYPLLVMEWVDGTALNRYVERHLDNPDALERLAEAWAELVAALEANRVAHGDLQHGNVLVEEAGDGTADEAGRPRLRLVDYDTMYVPALEGRGSAEVGHRNYQHPDRTDADFGPAIDRFAGLAVYTALRACAARPALWDAYDTGENLLFRDADYYDPASSPLFDDLEGIDALAGPVDALRTACYLPPEDAPSLDAVRNGASTPEPAAARALRGGRARRRPERPRGPVARWFAPGAAAGAGAAALLAGTAGAAAAALALAALVAAAGSAAGLAYRRQPVVRRRRRLRHEEERYTRRLERLDRQLESLRRQRQRVVASVDERRAERLDEVREEALHDRLKHHFIGEVREVEGIRHKHVVRLKAANIRTAYEAAPERLEELRRLGDAARTRIEMWRAALVRQYEDDIPDALSPAEERRLRRYVERRLDDIDRQKARTTEQIEVQRAERERVRERLNDMPVLTVGRYVRYLLRLDTLPERADGPPSPTTARRGRDEGGGSTPDGADTASPDTPPVPSAAPNDGPWWKG